MDDTVEKNRQKELLKVSYENIIRTALQNQNTYLYKKYIAFIGSFLQSVFLTWCSSGDTSYFPILFKNNEIVRIIVCFLPFVGILLFEILIGLSAIKIRKGIEYHFDMTMASWNKKLIKHILNDYVDTMKEVIENNPELVHKGKSFTSHIVYTLATDPTNMHIFGRNEDVMEDFYRFKNEADKHFDLQKLGMNNP